jgi:glyoxylase-like metal-dependent hydrolase (beta-lactamase superfamily II)
MGGDKPVEVRVESVAKFAFPGSIVRAGDGWGLVPMQVYCYQLIFPSHSAIIDTALTREQAKQLPGARFDDAAFARLGEALSKADLILITHEHVDHMGGLSAQADLARLLKSTRLSTEQVANTDRMHPARFPHGALDGYAALSFDKDVAVAPGVVLVKAPGHTPGSQLVYVQLQSGTEYLFLGDVAWTERNLEAIRGRPMVMAPIMKEDRSMVMDELDVLHRLAISQPQVHQIPGHDPMVIQRMAAQHLLAERFR